MEQSMLILVFPRKHALPGKSNLHEIEIKYDYGVNVNIVYTKHLNAFSDTFSIIRR